MRAIRLFRACPVPVPLHRSSRQEPLALRTPSAVVTTPVFRPNVDVRWKSPLLFHLNEMRGICGSKQAPSGKRLLWPRFRCSSRNQGVLKLALCTSASHLLSGADRTLPIVALTFHGERRPFLGREAYPCNSAVVAGKTLLVPAFRLCRALHGACAQALNAKAMSTSAIYFQQLRERMEVAPA